MVQGATRDISVDPERNPQAGEREAPGGDQPGPSHGARRPFRHRVVRLQSQPCAAMHDQHCDANQAYEEAERI